MAPKTLLGPRVPQKTVAVKLRNSGEAREKDKRQNTFLQLEQREEKHTRC